MNIEIKCNVSLSKKFRALSANKNTKFTLITGTLVNGVGEGTICMSVNDDADMNDLLNKETSVMIVPTSVSEEYSEIPNTQQEDGGVTSLFMNGASIEDDESPIIKKIGAVRPPDNKKQNATSIKPKQQIEMETPAPFKATQNPDAKKYIRDMNQLLEAIKLAENKKSNVDISKIQNPRLRAVAMEEKERAEAIDYPAFVVNDKCAVLTINDLGISLSLNIPYNLNNISAKRLANSKELHSMFRAGLIKFISPDEVQSYMAKIVEQEDHGLDVYDNWRQAESAIGREKENRARTAIRASDENELSLDDLDADTEEEKILKSLPPRRMVEEVGDDGEVIVTSHRANGGSRLRSQRDITADSQENSKGIKSIRRSGIQFN